MRTVSHDNPVSEEKKSLVDKINSYYLITRKSHEMLNGTGRMPLTNTPEVRRHAYNSLRNKGINVPDEFLESKIFDMTTLDKVTGWNLFWSLEMEAIASAIAYGGGTYERHLPARFLHYDLNAHRLASLVGEHNIKTKKFLELGCGSALTLTRLAQKGADVTGLDSAVMALEFAKYLADSYWVSSKVKLVEGDYFHTGLRDNEFDVTFNSGVAEHLNQQEFNYLLQEMIRVTKPGGYIVMAVPNENSTFYQRFKKRQQEIKDDYPNLVEIPVEQIRHEHDIERLMNEASLQVDKKNAIDGILVAPSTRIHHSDILDEDVYTFDRYLPRNPRLSVETKVAIWRGLELMSNPDFRIRYGWTKYYVGRKPK